MRYMSKWLLLCCGFVLSLQAHAALIQYDYSGMHRDHPLRPAFTLTGFVQIDSANLIAGINLVPNLVDWRFSWANVIEGYEVSAANQSVTAGRTFMVDTALNVSDLTDFCVEPCNELQHPDNPAVLIPGSGFWIASVGMDVFSQDFIVGTGTWSGPRVVGAASVPEPSSLGLLALGMGLVLRRRSKIR